MGFSGSNNVWISGDGRGDTGRGLHGCSNAASRLLCLFSISRLVRGPVLLGRLMHALCVFRLGFTGFPSPSAARLEHASWGIMQAFTLPPPSCPACFSSSSLPRVRLAFDGSHVLPRRTGATESPLCIMNAELDTHHCCFVFLRQQHYKTGPTVSYNE